MKTASFEAMRQLLVDNGWTWVTAVCTMLFSLMYWPCSTMLITIKKDRKPEMDGACIYAANGIGAR